MNRILFICKNREAQQNDESYQVSSSYTYSSVGKSSGLYNSVKFMVDMLTNNGIECKLVDVADNNCIDREVSLYKPTHVIIEALWVVPEKFTILTKLHPTVKWFVRLHSEVPFLANEGIAFDWIPKYIKYPNVFMAANSKRVVADLEEIYNKPTIYLPNHYPVKNFALALKEPVDELLYSNIKNKLNKIFSDYRKISDQKTYINIGCFGAIRPLKNQLIQAVAAIRYANKHGKQLRFNINGTRTEGKGEPVLRNIRSLFDSDPIHQLVEHEWMPHDKFLSVLKQMDVTMQVSFTETYNIVAADAIAEGVPTVSSKEISFVDYHYQADPTSVGDIINCISNAVNAGVLGVRMNREALTNDAKLAEEQWLSIFS